MVLKDEILQIEPELSGAVSSDAFDYQKDWAICKLIELHEQGSDYAVVFEYHEEIIGPDLFSTIFGITMTKMHGKRPALTKT